MNAECVQAIAESVSAVAGVLLIPAAIAAWWTASRDLDQQRVQHREQLDAQGEHHQSQMKEMETARRAQLRPYVIATSGSMHAWGATIKLKNVGVGPALFVEILAWVEATSGPPSGTWLDETSERLNDRLIHGTGPCWLLPNAVEVQREAHFPAPQRSGVPQPAAASMSVKLMSISSPAATALKALDAQAQPVSLGGERGDLELEDGDPRDVELGDRLRCVDVNLDLDGPGGGHPMRP